jgi:purine-binding chemotaxis protein CheW
MDQQTALSDEQQLVIFSLAQEEFGISISEVREIIHLEQITRLPNAQEYVRGVINLRGGIIVVVDLAKKLNLPSKPQDINTRIIVANIKGSLVGIIVDSATEVLRLPKDRIKTAPEIIKKKINAEYIQGVGILDGRLLILLDLEKILEIEKKSNLDVIKTAI